MQLSKLLRRLDRERFARYPLEADISCLCADSKKVTEGSLFVAIEGTKARGSDFIAEALKKGAACIIASGNEARPLTGKVPYISFADTRYALSVLADEFYGHPCGKLKVVGVTGTNGKTTITYLIRHILNEVSFSAGIIGTINYSFKNTIIPAPNTTPGPIELQSLLVRMLEAGCQYCIMEASSHGLDQQRTGGIDFKAAVFTNLTQDHLDYHLNLKNYFQAKAKLFTGLRSDAYAIINADCPFGQRLIPLSGGKVVTYAIDSPAKLRAFGLRLGLEGSEFILRIDRVQTPLRIKLIGRHNISNVLASVAFGLTQGLKIEDIQRALQSFEGVKGRLQRLQCAGKNIYVDYAHTPDALENVLGILRALSRKNLTVVFGCGGERDILKRPLMGEVAEKYADRIIITSDNPRSEEPEQIAQDIASGIKHKPYEIKLSRREAIHQAIAGASERDIILIAGKGHENYQIFKDKRIEFDDIMVAAECLRGMQGYWKRD